MFRVIEHVINFPTDPDHHGRTEWRIMISLHEGMSLFYPEYNNLYDALEGRDHDTDWMWVHSSGYEPHDGFWWTLNRGLAEEFIATHSCKVEVI